MFLEINNFLDNNFCNEIIQNCTSFLKKDDVDSGNREGSTVNITKTPELKNLDKILNNKFKEITLKKLIHTFNIDNKTPLKDSNFEFHRYKKGDQLYTHGDGIHFPSEEIFNPRILSLVVNLTDNENADLIFPRYNKKIKTEKGKLTVFLPNSCYEHYMNNNSNKDRDVLVTWLIDTSIHCTQIQR